MAAYNYKAIAENGDLVRGRIYAENISILDQKLQAKKLNLLHAKARRFSIFSRQKNKGQVLIQFTLDLEQLLDAGIPLIEAVTEIRDSGGDIYFSDVLSNLLIDIESGSSFSESLKMYPNLFPPVYVAMIEVGEQSGSLPSVLAELNTALEWQKALSQRLRKATYYPLFSAIVLVGVIVFLMTYLVPALTAFISSTAYELPWYTKWLLSFSGHISKFIFIYLITAVLLILMLNIVCRFSDACRYWWSFLSLKAFWIGPVLLNIKLARFAQASAMLYTAGITFVTALDSSTLLVQNLAMERSLQATIERIRQGSEIGQSFLLARIFPSMVHRMLVVGEKSGTLDNSLLQISRYYRNQADQSIARFEQSVGPVLILLVGMMLIWVIVAVLGPIYDAVFIVGGAL